jgi:transcriptional regulator with XRE-family HTH domain
MRATSPTVRRRELAARLRRLRLDAGLSLEDVAERMEVSAAKVSRMETGARGVSAADIRFLAGLYRLPADVLDGLLVLSRESRQRSWWQRYDIPDNIATYVGLEDAAVGINLYQTSFVPALLQTEGYARAVTAGTTLDIPEDQVEQRVQARLARQGLLTSDQPPELWAVLDEAALHRLVGGPAVMREQLRAMVEGSRRSNVTVQVIPLAHGAHPGMDSTFTILEFDAVADVVYVEGLIGRFFLQTPADLTRYRRAFDQLRAIALGPRESAQLIKSVATRLDD